MNEEKDEQPKWRPLTPEEQEDIKSAYQPYDGWPSVDLTYTKPTYKEVYTRYRRRHAKNPKITIREVCEEMGVDYDNMRAAKSRATKPKK